MNKLEFIFPIDGDVLTPIDGEIKDGSLYIKTRLCAPAGSKVSVNGETCTCIGETDGMGSYEITVTADNYRNTLNAEATKGTDTEKCSIVVYRFKKADKKYRLALDDIIWTMKDLTVNADKYTSLFDSPFFGIFKRLHVDFGTKVQFNIYYTDIYDKSEKPFDLTMVPDKYRDEFIANSSWMKLTCHAHNDTAHVYREAPYSEVYRDFRLVTEQLIRIAGKETVSCTVNGMHYGETTLEGARALRDFGIKCLVGYFKLDKNGVPIVSYYVDAFHANNAFNRGFWVDNREHIIFAKDDIVIDQQKLENISSKLDSMVHESPIEMRTLKLVTHEQYFYSHYPHYMPDYEEKIRTAVSWATKNGYEPCFLDEVIEEELPY